MQKSNNVDFCCQMIQELISELKARKIKLWLDGEALRYKAPRGVMTDDIIKRIGDRKQEIIGHLRAEADAGLLYEPICRVERKEYYNLSPAQKRMYIMNQIDRESTSYNIVNVLRIEGGLDKRRLAEVFEKLASRHDSLRTSFEIIDGEPVQIIHGKIDFDMDYIELKGIENLIDKEIREFIRPYDLSKAPLFRLRLVRLEKPDGAYVYFVLFDIHHIISDGSSAAILVKEFNDLYSGKTLPELNIQYKDYVSWYNSLLSSELVNKQKAHWLERFQGEIPVLNFPLDYPRPLEFDFNGSSVKYQLDRDRADRLYGLAHENRVTLFTLLLTAYYILLSKYTGQNDIIIGTPNAGRRHEDVYNTVGMFINTLALRNYPEPGKAFNEFLREVGANILEAFDNQDFPFEQLVDILGIQRDSSRNPVFDFMFILQNIDVDEIRAEGLKSSRYDFDRGIIQYDLTISATENKDGISIEIHYCTSLFKKETVERIGRHYLCILEAVTRNPVMQIGEIEMLTGEEKEQLIYGFNDTVEAYPKEKTINQLFEEQAGRTPDRTAVVYEEKSLTYCELNERSNCLARDLISKGVKPDNIVGLMVERSLEMIVGIIGILKAGGAYLPIDPSYPGDRINYMIEDSRAKIILTKRYLADQAEFVQEKVYLDDEISYEYDGSNLSNINKPDNLMYIIYTSGTTGMPKGVMIEHRNIVNLINYQYKKTNINFEDKILQFTTMCFDVCYQEIFSALLHGGELYLISEENRREPAKLFKYMKENNIGVLFLPTSYLKYISGEEMFLNMIPNTVKHIITAGEQLVISESLKEYLRERKVYLHNHYGPSETHVVTTETLEPDDEIADVPTIGKPISNTQIYILDKNNKIQPIGVYGEILIAGDSVGRGYFHRPELTEQKFLKNVFAPCGKIYKTGDLGRWLPDGKIEFLGRIDHQVKIRGYRIEPGEIEAQLMKHEAVKDVAVVARDGEKESKYLCAYIVSEKELSTKELRQHVLREMPEYMVPSFFIQLKKMPLTPNGKIDRKRLPLPEVDNESGKEYEAPNNHIEEKLLKIWEEVLGKAHISINANFFELGGHSLKATSLIYRINREFNVDIPMRLVFKFPTIKELAPYIKNTGEDVCTSIKPAEEKEYYPLSSAQKRLFLVKMMEGESITYNMSGAILIEGRLDVKRFEETYRLLIKRHESLRTSFELKDGAPVQIIHKNAKFTLQYVEFSAGSIDEKITKSIKPFDISKAPLIRACLIKLSPDRHILVSDMHHIISDGISLEILTKDFISLYNGQELPELKIQYKDFSEWQNSYLKSGLAEKQKSYWLDAFSGDIPVLEMPTDYTRPSVQNFEGESLNFKIKSKLAEGLSSLVLKTGTTMYMLLLAAYNVLLSKYTGQEDVVVGSPTAGRRHADLERIIGMFVNTLAMRNYPCSEKTFAQFLEEVKQNSLKAFENQDYQFEELVDNLEVRRDFSRNPLFDTMLVLQNMDAGKLTIEGLSFKPYQFNSKVAKFDITLNAAEQDGELDFTLEYCTKLFKKETIQRLAEHFKNILEQIVQNPQKRISDIDMISEEEKQKILHKFNIPGISYPAEKPLHRLFEEQVEKTPDSTALIFEDKKLTYRELNQKTNALARRLRQKGVRQESIVGIMAERSMEMIVGILAILKAGGAYLPIDPGYPADRISYMLEDSGAGILVTQESLSGKTEFKGDVVKLDGDEEYTDENSTNLENINTPDSLAYVIYTSGTTGRPKGVMIEHGSVSRTIQWRRDEYKLNSTNTVLQLFSFAFDGFVISFFTPIISGSRVIIMEEDEAKNPIKIKEKIVQHKVTHFIIVPALYSAILDCMSPEETGSLRVVSLGGDKLEDTVVKNSKEKNVRLEIANEYGPTEVTVVSTILRNVQAGAITIGKPVTDTSIYITDKNCKMQPVGVPGEICISGDRLARGYLGRPELTCEKFIPDPFKEGKNMYRTGDLGKWLPSGEIQFIGRLDHQIKIRGYRIETGEIESRMLKHEAVKEAVIIDREDANGNKYLCAYIVADKNIAVEKIKGQLAKELPQYMIPAYYVRLDTLPCTSSGKIDYKALKALPHILQNQEYVAPGNEIEQMLETIWKDLFDLERVSVVDNFFELGGHSLKAASLISRINREFNIDIPMRLVFKFPTIKEFAGQITDAEVKSHFLIQPVKRNGFYPVSSAQKRIYIISQFENTLTSYNIPGAIIIDGEIDKEHLENSFIQLIKRHEILRTSFEMRNGEPIQVVHENVNFHICCFESEEEHIDDLIQSFIRQFDLKEPPLLRVALVRLPSCRYLLIIDIHHIIADGVSVNIITKELISLYMGDELPEIRLQYGDFAIWQNKFLENGIIKKQEEYWTKVFAQEIPVLNIPTDFVRPLKHTYQGDIIYFNISKEKTAQLKELTLKTETTFFMILLAAFSILLSKYSGQEDIVVGTPIAGRLHDGLDDVIGMFVNTLAMRNQPEGNKTFIEFLNEVKAYALNAYENQDYQFEKLVEKLNIPRNSSRNPLFDTMFTMQNMDIVRIEIGNIIFRQYKINYSTAKFDLKLEAIEDNGMLNFSMDFNIALFRRDTIEKMAEFFTEILDLIIQNPETKIFDIERLSAYQKEDILLDFNEDLQ